MHFKLKSFKKKKEKPQIKLCDGVILAESVSMGKQDAVYDAVVKGIIEFLIVFGGIGGFLSCLEAPFSPFIVAVFCGIFAVFFSGLYTSGKIWIRDAGYIVFFLLFVLGIRVLGKYVNSGFYAIINLIYDEASVYFDMPAVREFTEYYTNRTLTITIFAIFIASVSIIVLNIYLSVYMSVAMAVAIGIPVFTIPLFFHLEPDSFYVILELAGLISVVIMKANGHFTILKDKQQFEMKSSKKRVNFSYCQSGRVIGQIIMISLLLVLIVVSMSNVFFPKDGYVYRYKKSSPKAYIEDHVENFLLVGFQSLFIRYDNVGGMSAGQLGGVAEVRSDYQTDLNLTFAPYTYDTMYLKAFMGKEYLGDIWIADDSEMFSKPQYGDSKAKMRVSNVGADYFFLYAPYYSELDSEMQHRYQNWDGIPYGEYEDYTFYPYSEATLKTVDEDYLTVPEENKQVLEQFCKDAKLGGAPDEIVSQLAAYFEANIPYTISPGATPKGEDFVNFFLTKNKKGFCVHFASAAVLIFRQMGIPARYIEGYAVPYSTVMEGDLMDTLSYDDFFQGESELGRTAVVSVDVNDSLAHAWVEVFIDGQWQVAEVTPPSYEEDIEDFWSVFGDWMDGVADGDGGNVGAGLAINTDNIKWLWIGFLVIVLGVIFLCFGRIILIKLMRIVSYHTKDGGENVVAYYRYLCNYMRLSNPDFQYAGNHLQQIQMMDSQKNGEAQCILATKLEQLSYGTGDYNIDTDLIMEELKAIRKAMISQTKWMTRIYVFGKL